MKKKKTIHKKTCSKQEIREINEVKEEVKTKATEINNRKSKEGEEKVAHLKEKNIYRKTNKRKK